MSKAFAFITNTTIQTLASAATVNPGTAQHGFGCSRCGYTIEVAGNNINLRESGYYSINVGATRPWETGGGFLLIFYAKNFLHKMLDIRRHRCYNGTIR